MTERFDAIIVGAGHNGLVCAGYLAKAGRKVLVLEAADQVGGAAKTHEFATGFRVSSAAHILNMFQPKVAKDLDLAAHGLDLDGPGLETVLLSDEGPHLVLGRDRVKGVSDRDAAAYARFMKRMTGHARVLAPELLKAPPRLNRAGFANTLHLAGSSLRLRFRQGRSGLRDLMRIAGMNMHDLLDEVFAGEGLKAAFAFDAVLGTGLEPRMPGTVLTYLYRLAGSLDRPMVIQKGGMGEVTQALAAAAEAKGAEIRLNSGVKSILLDSGRAAGVVLESGAELRADVVISNADPKTTFLKLVGARNLEAGFAHRIANFRAKGRAAKVHMALGSLPAFRTLDPEALKNRLVVAPTRRFIEEAYNPAKYGEIPKHPVMEVTIPSLFDPGLARDGEHVLSAIVQFVPFDVEGGWDRQRAALSKAVVETLQVYAPDIKDKMTALECLTPPDLERKFGISGGHWHHGELTPDQAFMLRPTYAAAQYQTPIEGLFLCGAGTHPGGGVSGAPGHNAAQAVLRGSG